MSWTVSGFLVYLFILSLAATPTNTECLSALLKERPCQAHFWFTLHSPLPEKVTPLLQPPVGQSDSVENFLFSYLALFSCLHQRKLRFKRSQQIAHCCTTCKWQSKDLIRNMWIQRLLFFTIKVAYQKTGKTPAEFLKAYILEISGKWKKSPIFFPVIRNKDSNCLDLFSFYRFLFVYFRATSWHFLCLQMREGLAVDCYPWWLACWCFLKLWKIFFTCRVWILEFLWQVS